jgi:pimeloyl-ACP methyl ester carboxylesterase
MRPATGIKRRGAGRPATLVASRHAPGVREVADCGEAFMIRSARGRGRPAVGGLNALGAPFRGRRGQAVGGLNALGAPFRGRRGRAVRGLNALVAPFRGRRARAVGGLNALVAPAPARGRWAIAALGGALAVLAGFASPARAQTEPPPPVLTWGACRAGGPPAPFQCATADVPLDYDQPTGATIRLALVRRPAERPDLRLGSVFVNPGGPGGSGFDFAVGLSPALPAALRQRFDVVGFDPRGVARSSAVSCWTRREYDAAVAGTRVLGSRPVLRRSMRRARRFVEACRGRSGALLPYVGTEYVARDLDLLRAAVGDERLTYLGFSFSTYVGTVYANLFPSRVRALTLDGAYDPVAYRDRPYDYDRGQFAALDGALSRFLAWCSSRPRRCGFGRGRAARAFDALVAALEADPARVGGGTVNAASLLYIVALSLNDGRMGWPRLGAALAREQRTGGRRPFPPAGAALASFFAANTAVECTDRAYPRSRALLRSRLRAHAALGPRLGRLFAYGPPGYDHAHATACTQWPLAAGPLAPSRYSGGFTAPGVAPIVVVGTTGDPDTPYPDAVALAGTLQGAKLLTFRGEGHTAFLRSPCVTEQVVNYLVDLVLPGKEVCSDEPPALGG